MLVEWFMVRCDAKAANDRLYKEYLRPPMARGARFKELATLKFRVEYHEFMQQHVLATLPKRTSCVEPSDLSEAGILSVRYLKFLIYL
jgi:hypothetical protein